MLKGGGWRGGGDARNPYRILYLDYQDSDPEPSHIRIQKCKHGSSYLILRVVERGVRGGGGRRG